jgi:hypothetical protein
MPTSTSKSKSTRTKTRKRTTNTKQVKDEQSHTLIDMDMMRTLPQSIVKEEDDEENEYPWIVTHSQE